MISYRDSSGRLHVITANGVHYIGRGSTFVRVS